MQRQEQRHPVRDPSDSIGGDLRMRACLLAGVEYHAQISADSYFVCSAELQAFVYPCPPNWNQTKPHLDRRFWAFGKSVSR